MPGDSRENVWKKCNTKMGHVSGGRCNVGKHSWGSLSLWKDEPRTVLGRACLPINAMAGYRCHRLRRITPRAKRLLVEEHLQHSLRGVLIPYYYHCEFPFIYWKRNQFFFSTNDTLLYTILCTYTNVYKLSTALVMGVKYSIHRQVLRRMTFVSWNDINETSPLGLLPLTCFYLLISVRHNITSSLLTKQAMLLNCWLG